MQCLNYLPQIEVVLHFFIGFYDSADKYIDDIRTIVLKSLMALGGFWFDCITSLPWSFMDLYAYQVHISFSSQLI